MLKNHHPVTSSLVVIVVALLGTVLPFFISGTILKHRHVGNLNSQKIFRDEMLGRNYANVQELWYTQRLDHFNPSVKDTWKQRYLVNDTFWDKSGNGPVFMVLGGEGPISEGYISDHFIVSSYAQQFGALVVAVEHRFYGKSLPKPNLSTQNLQYLTTEQALADYAVFRDFIAQQYQAQKSKFIAFGGSYSGNLSAWLRIRYPHLFHASLASSAPVRAQEDFSQYMDVVAASLGSSCNGRLRDATDSIDQLLATTEGRSQLSQLFGTCKPLSGDADDQTVFVSALADTICGIVQYNNDNNRYQVFNISATCSIIEQDSADSLQSFANFIKIYKQKQSVECIDSSYDEYLKELRDTRPMTEGNMAAAGRAWTWQYCNEFGYLQAAVGNKQPFSNKITLDWFLRTCDAVFDEQNMTPNVQYFNTIFGDKQPRSSRIIFSNGNIDPWHYLGVLSSIPPSQEAYLMNGTAHCADLYPARDADVPDLKHTRSETLRLFKLWLDDPTN